MSNRNSTDYKTIAKKYLLQIIQSFVTFFPGCIIILFYNQKNSFILKKFKKTLAFSFPM